MKNKQDYRIDRAYNKVYKYSDEDCCYLSCGRIFSEDETDEEIIKRMEATN